MKEKINKYTCIENENLKCIQCERRIYKLELIKAIVTPRMVLTVGFTILTIISMMKG